jgi:hypothetical protein
MIVAQLVEGGESPAQRIDRALRDDEAKPRASGRVGDFLVLPFVNGEAPQEARLFDCADTPVRDEAELAKEELRSEALRNGGVGWSCASQGVVLVNNEGAARAEEGGVLRGRGYIRSIPVAIVRDAPADRLQLIDVEGHPGILEMPVREYPYGKASLVVIERYPEQGRPGIIAFVEMAPSSDEAIRIVEELIP